MRIFYRKLFLPLLAVSLVLIFSPLVLSAGHEEKETTAADVKKKTAEAYQTLTKYTAEHRDEALSSARESLERLDARMEKVQAEAERKWEQMSHTTREKTRAVLKDLRKKRNEVAEWYGGMKHSSAQAWEEVKNGFAKSYDALSESVEKAREDFENSR